MASLEEGGSGVPGVSSFVTGADRKGGCQESGVAWAARSCHRRALTVRASSTAGRAQRLPFSLVLRMLANDFRLLYYFPAA
jgi:hypothetical protein